MCRIALWFSLIVCLYQSGASVTVLADSSADRPNILLLLTDDQAYDAVGSLGDTCVKTPHIDRLVRRGTTFTHAYNQGSWTGAVCVASRTMLNTGRFLWNAAEAAKDLEKTYVEPGRLWPQRLARQGYRTFLTGKWHVRADANEVFHRVSHLRPGMPRTVPEAYDRPRPGAPDSWRSDDRSLGGYWQGGRHWSEVVADDVEHFLMEYGAADGPFFIYAAFNAPHDPRQAPREYLDRYPPDALRVPDSFLKENPWRHSMGFGQSLRDELLAPMPRIEHSVRVHRSEYYALITHLDDQVGRICAALEDSGQFGNTVIVFTSDHGLACGRHGLMGKQNMYDHSLRVPLVICGPGFPQGATIARPVYMQDILPTTLELAGVEAGEDIQFRSLIPLVNGDGEQHYRAIYGAYRSHQRMVTDGRWKLVLYPEAPHAMLFDLRADPSETLDVLAEPENEAVALRLFAELQLLQADTADRLDLGPVYPGLAPSSR